MKNLLVIIGVIALVAGSAGKSLQAQIINGAYQRQDIFQRKPLALPSVREADVFWSKKIWRIIDVREKINQPLYFPTKEMDGRINLISLLLQGIESGQITAYDARNDDDFKLPITYSEVKERFGAKDQTVQVQDFDTGEMVERTMPGEIRTNEVKQYMLKEEWYFNKNNSTLNVRIIGICPIQLFVREDDPSGQIQRRQVFWVYYPEVRELLTTNEVFNPHNDARKMSFDDLFIKRYFNSYIVKESNRFDSRGIFQYLQGKQAMLESKRIENKIFNFEQDLWEY
ncbi:MAG: gliding motility protein GldN [Chlorobi bacterium]|nr:gliding motility protein GldN [Chlorobiota bacterium]